MYLQSIFITEFNQFSAKSVWRFNDSLFSVDGTPEVHSARSKLDGLLQTLATKKEDRLHCALTVVVMVIFLMINLYWFFT